MKKAHDHIEVVCNYSRLKSNCIGITAILHTIVVIFYENGVVEDASDHNYARANIKDCQWNQGNLTLLDHDSVKVVHDEAKQCTV